MSDTKPVTMEDGTPVSVDLREMYDKENAYGVAQYKGGDWPEDWSHKKLAELIERIARAEAREKRLRNALEAIKYALSDERPLGVPGWKPARDYLDARDIYNDDLNDLRVLLGVARAALNDKEGQTA